MILAAAPAARQSGYRRRVTEPSTVDLDRHVYGRPEAPITVLEYGDFECPYCRSAAPVLRKLIDGSGGRARLVWRHFPLFRDHPFALTAALAAEASGDRFWTMHDQLFAHQSHLTDADLSRYAAEIGAGDVVGDAAQRFQPAVEADYTAAIEAGVRGTPTLFIDGRLYSGRVEVGPLRTALGLDR
jgi:protein-disulfide isomerase